MGNTNIETLNTKQKSITENTNHKRYDLEDRTYAFSRNTFNYAKSLNKSMPNYEIIKQLIRSAGSIGANYIEANEALSRKDFIMRVKICKKEAKESCYWLKLSETDKREQDSIKASLLDEANQLMKIFGAILGKAKEV